MEKAPCIRRHLQGCKLKLMPMPFIVFCISSIWPKSQRHLNRRLTISNSSPSLDVWYMDLTVSHLPISLVCRLLPTHFAEGRWAQCLQHDILDMVAIVHFIMAWVSQILVNVKAVQLNLLQQLQLNHKINPKRKRKLWEKRWHYITRLHLVAFLLII